MLLLLDFFRVAPAAVLATSSVAFSLSRILRDEGPPPRDLRVRRVAGAAVSPCCAMLTPCSRVSVVWAWCRDVAAEMVSSSAPGWGWG